MRSVKIYDSGYRGDCPVESLEQVTTIQYIRKICPTVVHIRNEGARSHRQAIRHRAEGMTKGASDIMIPGAPAFVCELKRADKTKSRVTKEQQAYLEQCAADGAFACVAYGHEQAIMAFQDWRQSSKKNPAEDAG